MYVMHVCRVQGTLNTMGVPEFNFIQNSNSVHMPSNMASIEDKYSIEARGILDTSGSFTTYQKTPSG